MCVVCSIELGNTKELEKHIEDCHTYTCDACKFVGISEEIMENHIIEKHAQPDADKYFKCDDCNFKSLDKMCYSKHYKEKHGSLKTENLNTSSEQSSLEKTKLEEEIRQLKNNFERLETMYHDSLEEVNKVKSEYEAQIIKANDHYTVVKAENEALKEKVDVLFKLGRSYINNSNNEKATNKRTNKKKEEEDEIEIVEEIIEETTENMETLQGWSTNKMRGFIRMNPAAPPATSNRQHPAPKKKSDPFTHKPTPSPSGRTTAASGRKTPSPTPSGTPGKERHQSSAENDQGYVQTGRYCHFFVNQGDCRHEERTGNKCKFEHKIAPMCNFGMNCSRNRCMFSHPKVNGRNNFLGNARNQMTMMNPWQMMNPWMSTPPSQFLQNPWNSQGKQNNQ